MIQLSKHQLPHPHFGHAVLRLTRDLVHHKLGPRREQHLVFRWIRAVLLNGIARHANNLEDGAILDRRKLWEERMKAADLGGVEIVRSEEKYDRIKLLEQQTQQVGQENAMLKMVLQKANEVAPGVIGEITGGIQSGAE